MGVHLNDRMSGMLSKPPSEFVIPMAHDESRHFPAETSDNGGIRCTRSFISGHGWHGLARS